MAIPREGLHKTVPQLVGTDPSKKEESQVPTGQDKQNKSPKPVRTAPAGVPIPTKGPPAWRYMFYSRLGRPDWVPKLSRQEQLEYDIHTLESRLCELAQGLQITVSFLNVKGGSSKTTTSIYVGSVITDVTKLMGYVLPATTATETCTAALKAGISPDETLSITEFAEKCETLQSYRDLSKLVRPTRFGLRVIAEDPVDEISMGRGFRRKDFRQLAQTLRRNSDLVIYDTGNDNVARFSVPVAAVQGSDVLVFTATADNPETLERLSYTMKRYLADETTRRRVVSDIGGHRAEHQIPTAEKAAKSIVVISRTGKKESPRHYVDYIMRRDKRGTVIGELGFDGDIMLVPDDPHLANKNDVVADLEKIRPETYLAYLSLAVAIYEKAAELRGPDLSAFSG